MTKTPDDSSIWVRSGLNLMDRKVVDRKMIIQLLGDVTGRMSYGKCRITIEKL